MVKEPVLKKQSRKNMSLKRPGVNTGRGRKAGAGGTTQRMHEMLRVDHAGEYGAVRIYQGQIAVLAARRGERADETLKTVRHMEAQEHAHLAAFDTLLNERGVRPTVMTPLWHVAGYTLGAATALMGEKAAMACTAAVEEVIEGHYQDQIDSLGPDEEDLRSALEQFRDDEIAHKDTALENGAAQAPGYPVLSAAIKAGTRLAIRISQKI